MENAGSEKSISEKIIEAARTGRIKMRPKWHFILKAALAASGGVILVLLVLYLASFIIFLMHRTGTWFVPVFGLRGLYAFLTSLPWLLVVLLVFFAAILEVLVRHYSFAYRRPLMYSVAAIIIIVAVGGLVIAGTPVHRHLSKYAEGNRLPPFAGNLYRDIDRRPPRDIYRGQIAEITRAGFVIGNHRDSLSVIITARTRMPFGSDFSVGDQVVVFGPRRGAVVEAFGVAEVRD